MENKKLIKIGLIVIGVFFIFALIEAGIRGLLQISNYFSEQKEEKKQEEVVYNSDKETTKRQITTFLDNIFEAIDDADYQYVFDALDEVYREYMFHNEINELKEYIEENISFRAKHKYIRINQSGGMYQVLVGITEGSSYSSHSFTVKVINSNQCTFMFDEYTSMQKEQDQATYPNVIYHLSYYYETPDITGYVIDVENITSDDIKIEFQDSAKLVSLNGEIYEGNQPNSILVKPNQEVQIELLFLKQTSGNSYLQLNVMENDVPKQVLINLVEDIM